MEEINSDRAKFHAMTEGTREDWGLIGAEFQRFASGLPDRVLAHLKLLKVDFGGFPIDRLVMRCQPTSWGLMSVFAI
jgi:hypothetical protein